MQWNKARDEVLIRFVLTLVVIPFVAACSSDIRDADQSELRIGNLGVQACPGILDETLYETVPAQDLTVSPTQSNESSDIPKFSIREGALFRYVAFSGDEFSGGQPTRAIKWQGPVAVLLQGDSNYLGEAINALKEVARITGHQIAITDDPTQANFTICVALTYPENIDTLNRWNFSEIDSLGFGGAGIVSWNTDREIVQARVTIPRTTQSGLQREDQHIRSTIWEETVQSFGLINDFLAGLFSDTEHWKTSLFVEGPDARTVGMSDFDQRMLTALYHHIPVGSTWVEALQYIDIDDG